MGRKNDAFTVFCQQRTDGHDGVWHAPGEDPSLFMLSFLLLFSLFCLPRHRSFFLNSSLLGPAPSCPPFHPVSPLPAPSHPATIWTHSHAPKSGSYPLHCLSASLAFPCASAPLCALLSSLIPPVSTFPSLSLPCLIPSFSSPALDLHRAIIISLNSA